MHQNQNNPFSLTDFSFTASKNYIVKLPLIKEIAIIIDRSLRFDSEERLSIDDAIELTNDIELNVTTELIHIYVGNDCVCNNIERCFGNNKKVLQIETLDEKIEKFIKKQSN